MKIFSAIVTILAISISIYSCKNSANSSNSVSSANDKIRQKEDGTIELQIEKASCYSDLTNPASNTAEWDIVVSKPGRYKVWLSSATVDTMDLQYNSSVKISLQDERIDVRPNRDKIVLNTSDVKYPYFRADSYAGTFYIQEPGEYSLQVISEKVIANSDSNQESQEMIHTKLMSVILTPITN